jgi:small-conductance mechanosensitive channel
MENVVTKGAAAAEPMTSAGIPVEDLGGPTPENSRPDDDSNRLREPSATLKQVRDVVNSRAAAAEEVEVDETQEVVSEEETTTDEVVSEEEVVTEAEETEEELVEEEGLDIEADVQALLEGEELSEEFEEKARTIFEAAVKTKVAEMQESLHETYQNALVEEVVAIREELSERLDSYLEYVADEWFQENALAVEAGLKSEITESFLDGMKGLFEEHYVTIPEDKYNVLESMVDKLDEMEGKLNEQIDRNVALNRRLAESSADGVFATVSEGLADTQKEKLYNLAENIEFESETDYREKLVTLRKSYFPESAGTPSTSENLSEEVSTDEVISEEVSPMMQAYLDTLSRAAKN